MKKYSVIAIAVAVATVGAQAQDIEMITVIGQQLNHQASTTLHSGPQVSPDYRDTVSSLPGVDVNGNGSVTGIIQYRGLFGDRLATSIDGAPIVGAGPNAMDSPLSHVIAQPGLTVTMTRGIAPVSKGSETLGGSVDISVDNSAYFGLETTLFGQLYGQWQSPGETNNINASLGYSTEQFFVTATGSQQHSNLLDDGRGQPIPLSQFDKSAVKFTTGTRWGDHQLVLSYQRADTDDAGTPALGMDIQYIDAQWYRAQYQYNVSSDTIFTMKLFGNQNDHGMDNVSLRTTMDMMARLNTVDADLFGTEASWTTNTSYGQVSVGLDYQSAKHNSVITNPALNNLTINNFNNVERDREGVFAELQNQLGALHWRTGLRYTQVESQADNVFSSMAMMNPAQATLMNAFNNANHDLSHDFIDATLHIDYALSPHTKLHAAMGRKSRAPSYTELYTWLPLTISAGLADGFTYLGNLDLQQETADQIDLGLTTRLAGWTIAPRLYYQKIDDYIAGTPSQNMAAQMIASMMNNPAPLQWTNVDATLYGTDLTLTGKLTEHWSLDLVAALARGERDDIDDNLFRIAPASLQARLNWRQDDIEVMLETLTVASQNRVSQLQSEQSSAGYSLVNLMARYYINDDVTVTLNGNNLLDREYQSHLSGINRANGQNVPVGERLYGTGRQIALSLSVGFGQP